MELKLLRIIIMSTKYSAYCLITICLFMNTLLASESDAQKTLSVKDVYLRIGLENASLYEAFASIEASTDYKFSYHKEDLSEEVKINLNGKKKSVADILKEISRSAQLKFKQVNNNISVSMLSENGKQKLLEIVFEDTSISGQVTDENGDGLPGVNIIVKGSTVGSVTDIDGNYKIDVPDESILIFSFIGYLSQEVQVGKQSIINVGLKPDSEVLDEVVVVAYGTSTKRKFTGSVVSIAADEIENVPSVSIDRILQGRAAGVQVTPNNGQPGGSASIRIRGTGSISAGNNPLYVIDGVPINSGVLDQTTQTYNALASFNPNEIESISVLKDASAASIYGSRAANGVVIITTKRGKAGQTKFKFSVQQGVSDLENANNFRMMNSSEYIELMREGVINAGLDPDDPSSTATYFPIGADSINVDWLNDHAIQQGRIQQYELSASGGTEKTRFYISGSYLTQEGIVINTEFERFASRINLDHQANSKLNFGLNLGISHNNQRSRFGTSSLFEPIYGGLFVPPTIPVFATPEQIASGADFGTGYNFDTRIGENPIAYSDLNKNKTRTTRATGKLFANYEILEGLNLKSSIGMDYVLVREDEFFSQLYFDANGESDLASGREIFSNYFRYVSTNTAEYNKTFADKHNITLLVGSEFQKETSEVVDVQAEQFASDKIKVLDGAVLPTRAEGSDVASAIWGLFTRLNYSFDDKIHVSLSARRDGSSKFGSSTRYGNFWAAGLSYVLTQESFMDNLSFLDELKIRASYGSNGNQDFENFRAKTLYGFDGAAYITNAAAYSGSFPSIIGNPDLTWETNKMLSAAIEYSILDNRVSGVVEYYNRTSSDFLFDVPISRTSGFDEVSANVGEMVNKGWEVTLNTQNVRGGGFSWNTTINYAFNTNEVLALPGGADIIQPLNSTASRANTILREGESIHAWYIPEYAGVDPATGQPLWYDEDDNIVSDFGQAARKVVGSPNPDFFGSVGNTFQYKGFSLSVLVYFSYGNEILRHSARAYSADGARTPRNQDAEQLNRWQKPGDITDVPRFVYRNSDGGNNTSTRYLEDGSFVKLRNVTLAYQFPKQIIQKAKLNSARIYVQGQNLRTWTAYREFDPETGFNSNARGEYPIPRTITVGVELGF